MELSSQRNKVLNNNICNDHAPGMQFLKIMFFKGKQCFATCTKPIIIPSPKGSSNMNLKRMKDVGLFSTAKY